ncbi:imm11 family protein [Flavivirga algicola]|uniref:Phytochrome chromophore attachment site domain-containing protein n=1 Tax=Flavivirga algicola TaxID=2729136 RepID=A0ABX1S030_9FLAO|nr:DUF1629 domain-containing protein [Flavivirga algicola]NMH88104.1 hypothetical protein [Flavivirga algicola]
MYSILRPCGESDSGTILGVDDSIHDFYHFHERKSVKEIFKTPVELYFDDTYPDRVKEYDFLNNAVGLIIVSSVVKELWKSLGIFGVEYIETNVFDQRKKTVKNQYFIINILEERPLIDYANSNIRMSYIDKTQISKIKKLQVDFLAMRNNNALIFRAKGDNRFYYVNNTLLNIMKEAGITGLKAIEADGWNGRLLTLD